jgi:hypothetical protein
LLFAPQLGHFATIGEAHSLQNFAPSGFSAEQFWQRINLPVDQATSPSSITRRREGAAGCKKKVLSGQHALCPRNPL